MVTESALINFPTGKNEWPVEVFLHTTLEQARRHIAPEVAVLEATAAGVTLRCYTDNLPWMARVLAGLECQFIVHRPVELKEAIKQHARLLMEMAEQAGY
jgi:predicted DNA-binding transcriptional regulator YafY